jgi:hypothetical protein
MNKRNRKPKTTFALFLLMTSLSAMQAWGEPLTREEIDSLLGSRTEYSRREVADLIAAILSDADEEIIRTAEEAAREVAADDAGEIAVLNGIVEDWKRETARNERKRIVWRNAAFTEFAVILGGALVVSLAR